MKRRNEEEGIDIKALIIRFINKWYYFAIALIICITLAFLKIKTTPKVYEVSSILKMNTGNSKAENILDEHPDKEEQIIDDEIVVIKSSDYIRQTLNQLDFTVSYYKKGHLSKSEVYKNDFPVNVILDTGKLQLTGVPIYINIVSENEFEIKVNSDNGTLYNFKSDKAQQVIDEKIEFNKRYTFGEPIDEKYFSLSVLRNENSFAEGNGKLYFTINSPNALVDNFLKKLEIQKGSHRDSRILKLFTQGSVVKREIDFLNTLMEVVKRKDLEEKNQEDVKTIDFINNQLSMASENLDEAEQNLESFQYTTTQIGESSALYEKRDQLESEISDLNVRLRYYKNVLSNIESAAGVSNISAPSSVGVDNTVLSNLLLKLTELHQQKAQLERTATEANPVFQRTLLEIKTTKDAIKDNLKGAISSTNIAIENAEDRLRQTNSTINRLPSTQRRRIGIERQFEFTDNTYDMLLQRKAEAGISLATNVSDWKVIENASVEGNSPVSPKTKFLLMLAIVLGLVIPAFVIVTKDYFDDKVKSKSDIERITNIPFLGAVTKGVKYHKLVSEYEARSPLLESLRNIRINLQYLSTNKNQKIIGFTSSTSGEGKTFCSVNLGIIIAQSGKKVLVIDADLRNSSISNYFNFNNKHGLSSYLIERSSLSDIVMNTKINNLDLIQAGPIPPNPSDLLSLPKMDFLINELKEKYDYIVIDAPPLGIVSDYILLSTYVDASIYVTRYNFTKKHFLDKVNELYESKKVNNISILLNDVKLSHVYGELGKDAQYNGYFNKETAESSGKKEDVVTA